MRVLPVSGCLLPTSWAKQGHSHGGMVTPAPGPVPVGTDMEPRLLHSGAAWGSGGNPASVQASCCAHAGSRHSDSACRGCPKDLAGAPSWEEHINISPASAAKGSSARTFGSLALPISRQHPHSPLHATPYHIRLLQQLCIAIPGRERAPAAVLLPAPARSCPGLTPGQLEQADWGAWTCPMPSRVACLQRHKLPWAASGEAGADVGKSWHPLPCSYSQQAEATPALEGRPPGCT